jgi:hypothetical protein
VRDGGSMPTMPDATTTLSAEASAHARSQSTRLGGMLALALVIVIAACSSQSPERGSSDVTATKSPPKAGASQRESAGRSAAGGGRHAGVAPAGASSARSGGGAAIGAKTNATSAAISGGTGGMLASVAGAGSAATSSAAMSVSAGASAAHDIAGSVALPIAGMAGATPASAGGTAPEVSAPFDPKFLVFLLIGQSNMEGVPAPEAQDLVQDPRVQVLAFEDCSNVGRTYNEWYAASPPLHGCDTGVGPGDYFGKTMIAPLGDGYSIGLVPCAIGGVDIDFFRKGVVSAHRSEFKIPPDDHWSGAYEWVLTRAKLAQQRGVIRGVLFHQGESDNGMAEWVGKVSELVTDLRADLALTNDAPFLAGELYYGGCCAGHNMLVQQLPSQIPNTVVISAEGLNGIDQYHFDLPGQRELGKRYGTAMLDALKLP